MKILCALDGSDCSNWVVEAAGQLFHDSLKEVILLNVVDSLALRRDLKQEGGNEKDIRTLLHQLDMDAETVLKTFRDKLEVALNQSRTRPFVNIRAILAHGHVVASIIRQAQKHKCDVLIVGSRGTSDISGYLLGSVSRKVLAHATCPVLMVKRPLHTPAKVLLAVDGSKPSKRAVRHVRRWFRPETVVVQMLSVIPPILTDVASRVLSQKAMKSLTAPYETKAHDLVHQHREEFLKEGYTVSAEVLKGKPRDVILAQVEKTQADLVVLGSRGLTGLTRYQMGSVSEWVSAYTPCSVLVVHPAGS